MLLARLLLTASPALAWEVGLYSFAMDMPSVDFVGIAVAALVLAVCALVMWLGRP
jgi:ABC-type maltose transport system permease subunit